RLIEFSYRRGSGGAGRFSGGDGLVREMEVTAPLTVSILSDRRRTVPFGIAGGQPGAGGCNFLAGEDVGGVAVRDLLPGQRIRIETPGGGGYGVP
ncbi:MAG: hydantoinase B/oxoprolinase family protein, partial [Myxococcales bacterium]|nr:hydantoinase B/oxoprolinase family protein [Myxococcales bacterium]